MQGSARKDVAFGPARMYTVAVPRPKRKYHPHVLENILSAMSRIDTPRLLDRRFLDFDQGGPLPSAETPELLPVLTKGD